MSLNDRVAAAIEKGIPQDLIAEAVDSARRPQTWKSFAGAWRRQIRAAGPFADYLLQAVHRAAMEDL